MTQEEKDKVQEILDDCSEVMGVRNCPFSPWQKDFIESVASQFEDGGFLTSPQYDKLVEVWDCI